MDVSLFIQKIHKSGINTITGIPDSTLRIFCDYLANEGKDIFDFHIVPENEGGCIGIAVGEYLSTGSPACVYMQNSGLGNAVNPVTSLANSDVYGIPMLFIIGWRGEPGRKDEQQHKFMGKITLGLLELLEIPYAIIDATTTGQEMDEILKEAHSVFRYNRQFAILVKSGTFGSGTGHTYQNGNSMSREGAVAQITGWIKPDDIIVSTTGKISRELYEQADGVLGNHDQIFLTVGGMGHAGMIALQLANRNPARKVICLDGDGALLMHMGSMAVTGNQRPDNLIHICLDNGSHESVGGMPTGAVGVPYDEVARQCGYPNVFQATDNDSLGQALRKARAVSGVVFIEIRVTIGSRADLLRPGESAAENKCIFMKHNGVN